MYFFVQILFEMKKFLFLIAIIPIISGCCACRKGSPVIGNLESTIWTMVELNENPITDNFTITFDASSKVLTGGFDCYKVYSGYHLFEKETGNIEFLQPGSKGEGCPENPMINDFVAILSSVSTVKIDGGHLIMIDSSQNIVAVFKQ